MARLFKNRKGGYTHELDYSDAYNDKRYYNDNYDPYTKAYRNSPRNENVSAYASQNSGSGEQNEGTVNNRKNLRTVKIQMEHLRKLGDELKARGADTGRIDRLLHRAESTAKAYSDYKALAMTAG